MRDSACRWFIVKKAKIFWSYVKVGLSPSKKKNVICFIERSLKMMKNAFYFILKAVFVLKIVKFFVMTFWSSRENGFIRKLRLTARFMTWFTNNYNTHSANISRNKSNQTMKFDQSIEYNKRNIFPQKLCKKWGRETSYRLSFIF